MKKEILVNLKRFEVSRSEGGVCDFDSPEEWVKSNVVSIIESGLGCSNKFNLTMFVPEILLPYAAQQLEELPTEKTVSFTLGTQSCHRKDVESGKNFGAFTSLPLVSTQKRLGSNASLIGHCEERGEMASLINSYLDGAGVDVDNSHLNVIISRVIGEKVALANTKGMKTVLCIGETALQQGEGSFEDKKPRIERVLLEQITNGLAQADDSLNLKELVIAYEPIWAIGPGKTPPGKEYVEFVTDYIKKITKAFFQQEVKVVYGGGLKQENAPMLSSIEQLDGGLIALTNFADPIGFNVPELKKIIAKYVQS